MRKLYLGAIIMASLAISSSVVAYETQGFDSYTENGNSIQFSCSNQCIIMLGEKGNNDMIKVTGVTGAGELIAWAMTDQLYAVTNSPIQDNVSLRVNSFNNQPIPPQVPMVLVIQGTASATQWSILFTQANVVDNIGQAWKDFWAKEGQTFYGINLRYGTKILDVSIVTIGYRIFVLGLILLYLKKKLTIQNSFYLGLGLFLLIGLRNQIDYSQTTSNNIQSYVLAESGSKVYGNLGDYYEFMSNARKVMELDSSDPKACKLYTDCSQPWPFCVHMDAVFMKPCEKVENASDSDYQIYYKKEPVQSLGTKIREFNWSYLYQTK